MPWIPQTCRAPRRQGGKLALLLVTLVAVSSAALAGCGSPPTSAAQQTPDLHFVLDGNFLAATSAHDLRYTLVALRARVGHVAWRHALEAPSPADATGARYQPVYQGGLVYVGYYFEHSDDQQNVVRNGVVEALDAGTGNVRWRREVGTDLAGEPVVDGSAVYASASVFQQQGQQPLVESGLLEALDTQTGTVRWQRALEDTPSMAASADGRVFVMASHLFAGHLLALNASDGSVAWDYTSDAPLSRGGDEQNGGSNAPLVVGGRVFAQAAERDAGGAANLKLVVLNARDGSMAWQHQSQGITATPAFNQGGDVLCISAYDGAGNASTILGLAASSGATRWSISDIGIVSGCTAAGDIFYLTQRSNDRTTGSIFALNSQDGQQRWKTPAGPPVAADGLLAPAVENGVVGVYLVGPAPTHGPPMDTLAVLRASDGKLLWRHDFGGIAESVMDVEGDLIFNPELYFNPELSSDLPIVTAYALDTGARQWSYALGHL